MSKVSLMGDKNSCINFLLLYITCGIYKYG